jgi:predicted Zn-dependent peptidase
MPFHQETLPNGLQLIGETNASALAVGVGFFVRTGSRDETPAESGLSHFLEHMVFKGTPNRSAQDVNTEFDRIGADYNAYTSEENTVYYATVLPEFVEPAVDLLADILRPSLREDDFATEKQVILEEIAMYEDQPTWPAYDRARKLFFAGHPLGNTVLGSKQSVTDLTPEGMRAYFDRRYVASNITVAVAGNYHWPTFVEMVRRRCAGWPAGDAPRTSLTEPPANPVMRVVAKEKTAQEHVILITPGPSAESPLRYAADVLALALGDDSGSRLYWELVDPGLAESAGTGFYENQGAGMVFTSFSGDPEEAASNLEIVRRVLADVQKNGITDAELQTAKNKITSRLVRGAERTGRRMQALGSCWTYLRQFHDVDAELRAFEAVELSTIRAVLDRYPLDRTTVLAYGPLAELAGVAATPD